MCHPIPKSRAFALVTASGFPCLPRAAARKLPETVSGGDTTSMVGIFLLKGFFVFLLSASVGCLQGVQSSFLQQRGNLL